MKVKFEVVQLEEGMLITGYALTKDKALRILRRRQRKEWGIDLDECVTEEELEPIYQLTTIEQDYERRYSWETKPQHPEDRIIGWGFTI